MVQLLPIALFASAAIFNHWLSRAPLPVFELAILGVGALLPIYFSEQIGSYTGWMRGTYIDEATPGPIIKILGWAVLVILCIALLALY